MITHEEALRYELALEVLRNRIAQINEQIDERRSTGDETAAEALGGAVQEVWAERRALRPEDTDKIDLIFGAG